MIICSGHYICVCVDICNPQFMTLTSNSGVRRLPRGPWGSSRVYFVSFVILMVTITVPLGGITARFGSTLWTFTHFFFQIKKPTNTHLGLLGNISWHTIAEMADLEVPVQTDNGHCDEAPTTKEEARPAVETTSLPAEQPAVGETRHNEKGLSCHCKDREGEGWGWGGGSQKNKTHGTGKWWKKRMGVSQSGVGEREEGVDRERRKNIILVSKL